MVLGRGAFGEVKRPRIHKLGITVAEKVLNKDRSPNNVILAEVIVGMILGAHPNFPHCLGLLNSDTILMELLIPTTTLCLTFAQHCQRNSELEWLQRN